MGRSAIRRIAGLGKIASIKVRPTFGKNHGREVPGPAKPLWTHEGAPLARVLNQADIRENPKRAPQKGDESSRGGTETRSSFSHIESSDLA